MPVYPYKCPRCQLECEEVREVDQRNEPVLCSCGEFMERKMATPTLGKPSYQFKLINSHGGTMATGKGGPKKGRWVRK
jgi:predicted nucleic acid-binding Zn ribbon protein